MSSDYDDPIERPLTRRDVRPATTRDSHPPASQHRPGTRRDVRPETVRDSSTPPGDFATEMLSAPSDMVLPDYLAREYDIADDLNSGAEADVALIKRRRDGHLKVVKIYRRGITLPEGFVERLASADPRHVLPVTRSTYTGWRSPRFIEVMDYLPHGSLETLLDRAGGAVPDLAGDILVEMTDALDYIHNELGIVHRDIKPANILIRNRQPLDLVLADLGIAAEVTQLRMSRRETTGGVKGTLIYQSPETLNRSNAGAPRDWWALGMTMCEVLTGQHPFKYGRGDTLHDEGRIRDAITMGDFDLSMIRDQRWNLLCRGLLTHNPDDRWAAQQVRAWLAGESPPVAALRPPQHSERTVRPYRFAGQRFTDPVVLASHMVTNWDAAAAVFTSAEECGTLRAWIREDVNDSSIDVNALTPVTSSDQPQVDARIIEFTTHYRGGEDVTFRGARISSHDLAVSYLRAGEGWDRDPLLSALQPAVLAALTEAQLDENAGPDGQSGEYYALARLSRYAESVDRTIEQARSDIMRAASTWVAEADVGVDVRDGLPVRVARARAVARAALLSPTCLAEVRSDFGRLNTTSPRWFAELAAQAAGSHRENQSQNPTGASANATEVALKALAIGMVDLAIHYEHVCANARRAAEQRRSAEEAAEAEAARQRAIDDRRREIHDAFSTARRRAFRLAQVWLFLCFVILANNFISDPQKGPYGFADGSYGVVTWSLIFMLAGGLVVDLAVGRGQARALVGGAAAGFLLTTYTTFSQPNVGQRPLDISMFWLTALFGVLGYLVSALLGQRNGNWYQPEARGRQLMALAGILALVVSGFVVFNGPENTNQTAHGPTSNPITTGRQVVVHPTITADATNDVIRGMAIGSCWNGRWSWSATDGSYMPVSVPTVVDCSSPDATQSLDMIADNCSGTSAQMILTQRAMFDGQAHCLLLVPSEGMCIPMVMNGNTADYTGMPVVCDTPPSPRYPSLMHLMSRLQNQNDSCNTSIGNYYIWFDAVNSGFCYTIDS